MLRTSLPFTAGSGRSRNFLYYLRRLLGLCDARRDISWGDNADDTAFVVYPGHPPHLILSHNLQRLLDILLCVTGYRFMYHDFFNNSPFGVTSFGHNLRREVAI